MAIHNDIGKLGEDLAIKFLIGLGYEILERNWRFGKSEIDIIAKDGNYIVNIEVKSRTNLEFGNPEEFINHKKIKRITEAFDYYIIKNNIPLEARFDVISVHISKNEHKINHIKDAFLYF